MGKLRLLGVLLLTAAVALPAGGCGGAAPHASSLTTGNGANGTYVALGDSVAAGAGLNPHPANSCNRSTDAYPVLVGARLGYRVISIACAGATVTAGLEGGEDSYAPQLNQLFALHKPKLITITIGGNDIGYSTAIQRCAQIICSALTLPPTLTAAEAVLRADIRATLSKIASHYAGQPPTVILTGYYQLIAAAGGCPNLPRLQLFALAAGSDAVAGSLNDTIREAIAPYPFARFAPVNFSGHQLCTSDPWVQGALARAPYHPTAAGQEAYAAAVIAAVKGSDGGA